MTITATPRRRREGRAPFIALPIPDGVARKFLRRAEVLKRVPLHTATIYRMMAATPPTFPPCYRLSANAVGWLETDIEQYCENRPGGRQAA